MRANSIRLSSVDIPNSPVWVEQPSTDPLSFVMTAPATIRVDFNDQPSAAEVFNVHIESSGARFVTLILKDSDGVTVARLRVSFFR